MLEPEYCKILRQKYERKKRKKRPFVWEPEYCPCARARGGALSPGDGAYSPTDDHRRLDYDDEDSDLIII